MAAGRYSPIKSTPPYIPPGPVEYAKGWETPELKDVKAFIKNVRNAMREMSQRIRALEDAISESGIGLVELRAVEDGIVPGMLLYHNTERACWLAKSTDADRYCTAVCVARQGGIVIGAPLTHTYLFVTTSEGSEEDKPLLYLSPVPGFATFNANGSGALYMQIVGRALEERRESGRCLAAFNPAYVQGF